MFGKQARGFTLIELLIVIAIIAILAAAVIVAINPARQFSQARNSTRTSNVNTIVNAIQQNAADNNGTYTCAAGALPATTTAMTSAVGGYDICGCVSPTYLSSMPFDPSAAGAHFTSCADYATGYTVVKDAVTSRVTVNAPSAELGQTISASQ